MEDLPDAEAGDEPRVQQQVVPLSAWNITPASAPAPDAPPSAPAPDATAEPVTEAEKAAKAKAAADLVLMAARNKAASLDKAKKEAANELV